jgi:hypothetical protein
LGFDLAKSVPLSRLNQKGLQFPDLTRFGHEPAVFASMADTLIAVSAERPKWGT